MEACIFNPCIERSPSPGRGCSGNSWILSMPLFRWGCPVPSLLTPWPLAACKPHACAFSIHTTLFLSLPSVLLFITPPCTVKPPIMLPLLLLLLIYCTCRVKWLQWQGPAFFPPFPPRQLEIKPLICIYMISLCSLWDREIYLLLSLMFDYTLRRRWATKCGDTSDLSYWEPLGDSSSTSGLGRWGWECSVFEKRQILRLFFKGVGKEEAKFAPSPLAGNG